ncbi:MAG: hypothetical protein ACF8TS_07080 [Maioricimonas sp. JB049]
MVAVIVFVSFHVFRAAFGTGGALVLNHQRDNRPCTGNLITGQGQDIGPDQDDYSKDKEQDCVGSHPQEE